MLLAALPARSAPALSACGDEGPEASLRCAVVEVPENPAHPQGRRLELRVTVAPAVGPRTGPPVFVLEGGPGRAASANAVFYVTEGDAYRRGRELVMVDVRGTGGSYPLHCPELEGRPLEPMYPADGVEACRDRLRENADLTQYTTDRAVGDLEAARTALGYAEIDLMATSYGTRLAFEYLRRHPDRVRSVVAIGALSFGHRMPLHHARSFERAWGALLADCEADPACRSRFPALRQSWARVVERLASGNATHVQRAGAPDEAVLAIQRGVFVDRLRSELYFASAGRALPGVVAAAAAGDFGPFVALAAPEEEEADEPGLAEGFYLSVTCAEDVPFIADEDVERLTRDTDLGDYRVARQRAACEIWPRGEPDPGFGTPFRTDKPVLLITGGRDPVTPPAQAHALARSFARSRVLVVPHAGHLPWDASEPGCVDGLILEFLANPDPAELDASCLGRLEPPPFPSSSPG